MRFDGHILGAAFASGDRFVAGRWFDSPFGGVADVMWARPNGNRVLLAGNLPLLEFVDSQYRFDHTEHTSVRVESEGDSRIRIDAGPVRMNLELGSPGWVGSILRLRPRPLRELPWWIAVEDAVLRPVMAPWIGARGVRTRGVTAAGIREWYAIHDLRPIARAQAWLDGEDLGLPAAAGPAGFGFSEFPERPALVRVTALFEG
jgi:hypothetical protein